MQIIKGQKFPKLALVPQQNQTISNQDFKIYQFDVKCHKAITSVGRPKMKRDAGVKAVFLLRKKTAITPASLFIFGRRTDVTLLVCMKECIHFCLSLYYIIAQWSWSVLSNPQKYQCDSMGLHEFFVIQLQFHA